MADRLDLRRRLHQVAFRQAGYFTAGQAKSVGYSYQAQKYHVDRGNWVRIDRGLLRLAEWPHDADDDYARWSTWSEGRGVISHHSASLVHDIGDLDPALVHMILPPPATRGTVDGVALHTATLAAEDVASRNTFRVTTPTRTVLDLAAADITQEALDTVLADAVDRGMVSLRSLQRRMDDFGDRAALRLERALAGVAMAGRT